MVQWVSERKIEYLDKLYTGGGVPDIIRTIA